MPDQKDSRSPHAPASSVEDGEINPGSVASKWQDVGRRDAKKPLEPGLYVTATPIGNLEDVTLRALRVFESADLILCEDSRVTGKLLNAFGIKGEMLAYHDHNAEKVRPRVLERLAAGAVVALVSDAGTPLISDPGYKLVRETAEAGHGVFTVPGPSSVAAALSIAGLPTDRFLFAGFLPPKSAARRKALEELKPVVASLVLLEGPSRLQGLLKDASDVLGEREVAVARELTKLHEEVRRGTLVELALHYENEGAPKGEIVVVIAPPTDKAGEIDVDAALLSALKQGSVKDAASEVAEMTGQARRVLYARALELSRDKGD